MGVARWFADQSIGRKVYGGFAMIVALAGAALTLSLSGLTETKGAFTNFRDAAQESVAIGLVTQTVAEVRLEVRRYVHQPSDLIAAEVAARLTQLDNAAEALAKEVSEDPDLVNEAQKIAVAARNYRAGFAKAVAAQKRFDGQLVATRNAATQLESNLSAIVTAATHDGDATVVAIGGGAFRTFFQVRIAATQFLLTFDPALVQRTLNNLDNLAGDLRRLEDRSIGASWADAAADAKKGLAAYRTQFQNGSQAQLDRNAVVATELQVFGKEITDTSAALRQRVADRQDRLGPQVEARANNVVTGVIVALAAMIAAGVALAAMIGRGVAVPARRMTQAMTDLADGRLDTEIPAADRRDEIGGMAAALAVFRDALKRNRAVEAEQRQAAERRAERAERIAQITGAFDAAVSGVLGAVAAAAEQMRGSAAAMADASRQVGDQAAAVAAAADDASANVNTVAASAEELTASINEIGRQVEQAARVAAEATEAAAHTSGVVGALADSARRIGQVVGVINDIAGQTNLLALNATIEAARAGEAGRGFAVVASEVKTLASQTARATEDVSRQVQEIQTATDQAVAAIDGILAKVERINGVQHSIAAAVEEQTAVTRDIARNTQAAAGGAEHVSEAIDAVDAAARGAGQAADQVLGASRSLADQSATLKRSVDGFLEAVRTA